jgi:hypothetical protein
LIWAVAGAPDSNISNISDLFAIKDYKFGVSRLGSGSYTMAHYLASKNEKKIEVMVMVRVRVRF